jgi:hypothetical protein
VISKKQSNQSEFKNRPDEPTKSRNQRARFFLFAAGIPIIVFAILAGSVIRNIETPFPPLDPEILMPAISEYRQDRINRGEPILDEVSFTQMIRWGYLEKTKTEASGVDEIYFSTKLKGNILPQDILCRTEFLDGEQIVLLGDGSVQQFSTERFRTLNRDTGKTKPAQKF